MKYQVTHELFDEAIDRIVSQIDKKYDVIIAPSRGGLIPGTVLSHRLDVPFVPFMHSTRDHVTKSWFPSKMFEYIEGKYKEFKRVLLVEDIIDSGTAVRQIRSDFFKTIPRARDGHVDMDVAAIVYNLSSGIAFEFSALSTNVMGGFKMDRSLPTYEDAWIDFWWESKGE